MVSGPLSNAISSLNAAYDRLVSGCGASDRLPGLTGGQQSLRTQGPASAGHEWDGHELTIPQLHTLYRGMLRVRALDTKAMRLQRQGRISFFVPSFGEEAAHVGSAFALAPNDWIFPCYREQGAALLRGYPLEKLVCQLMGNREDYMKGRQMPNHFGSPTIRFAVASSVVGTQISHAVGAAYASRLLGENAVALAYFGDGATSCPDFHAGMNLAALWKAGTVFFCKNNGYAISMPVARQTCTRTLAEKAAAYGVPGLRVDGNDVLAVYLATKEAVARARRGADEGGGRGPTLIEAVTYRVGPHTSADDPSRYRDPAECEAWQARDPISHFRRYLEQNGWWSSDQEKEAWTEVKEEVDAAFQWAEQLSPPDLESLVEDVYFDVPWHLREQLDGVRAGWHP
jgi:pyruvate dehydrogenase E1 component alpha subunit